MSRKKREVEVRPPSRMGERVVVLFLLLATAALAYVHLEVLPGRRLPEYTEFDLRNPILRAAIGDCVEVETLNRPGEMVCQTVAEPGLVLRPRLGPDRLGPDSGLHRSAPYLVCHLRSPPLGKGCSGDTGGSIDMERFDVNGFGIPAAVSERTELLSIRPEWKQRGGRYMYVYTVELHRYGHPSGPWIVSMSPEAPVTGTVYRQYVTPEGEEQATVFREVPDCR